MRFECQDHGLQEGVQVSPDLESSSDADSHEGQVFVVRFQYDGEVVDAYYLSERFANSYGLTESFVCPLPDEYPEWVSKVVPRCRKCFRKVVERAG